MKGEFSTLRTELLQLTVVPSLAPHPVQVYRQLAGHRYFGNLSSSPHGKVEEPPAPLGLASYRDWRRFYQQKPEQRIALLADVPQSGSIATGLFRRHQSHIADHLLAAVETFRSSNHSEYGKQSLAHIVRVYAGHDLNHLAQVEKIARENLAASAAQ